MKYFRTGGIAFIFFLTSLFNVTFAQDRSITVGNAAEEVSSADGPEKVQVDMNGCEFSMMLGEADHVKYNDPDLVLYRSIHPLAGSGLPYLKQAEMATGYDWWFEEPGTVKVPWVGLMCENASDFKWSWSTMQANVSPELQDIMDANSLRCPADFDGKKWIQNHKNGNANFKNIDVVGAIGFAVESMSKEGRPGSRFCFVHGGNVLIGVSGGGVDFLREIGSANSPLLNVLRSIEFKSDIAPLK